MCCCVAVVLVWSVCLSLWLVVVTTVAMEQWWLIWHALETCNPDGIDLAVVLGHFTFWLQVTQICVWFAHCKRIFLITFVHATPSGMVKMSWVVGLGQAMLRKNAKMAFFHCSKDPQLWSICVQTKIASQTNSAERTTPCDSHLMHV